MQPTTRTYAADATGPQEPIALDYLPISRIVATVTSAGSPAFAVEVTLDNVTDDQSATYVAPANARWFPVTDAPDDATGYVNFPGPWWAIRMNITSLTNVMVFQVGQGVSTRW